MKTIKKITENLSFSLFNNYETIRKIKNKINEVIDAVNSIPAPVPPEKELPDVSSTDNGDILAVVSGKWAKSTPQKELPDVSSTDNGDVLTVVNGAWAKGSTMKVYSTSEKLVGIWTDGSYIYERTYFIESPVTDGTQTNIELSIEDIDTIIDYTGGWTTSGKNRFNLNYWYSSSVNTRLYVSPVGIIYAVNDSNITGGYVTFTYTKESPTES